MRILVLSMLALSVVAAPAAAQFTARYEGTQLVGERTIPVTTQFSVEKGRVVMRMVGEHASRMVFVEKDGFLRVIDDSAHTVVDIDRKALTQQTTGALEQAQQQLAKLPPEQRAMAEGMMKQAMGAMKPATPTTYVTTQQSQRIKGYDCTRVDVMEGDVKKAEYWGSRSPDFQLGEAERATVIAMQGCLRDFTLMATSSGAGGADSRPFQWDTSIEGFPLISRCFRGDVMTLDLHLSSFDRKPIDGALFEVPDGYAKQSFGMGERHGPRHTR